MIETPEPSEEGWRIEGRAQDVLPFFADWAAPLRDIIENAERLHRWALFVRDPLPKWSDDTAVLIGDAAHPMLPSFAQGAVQALEDAWCLAALIAEDAGTAGARLFAHRRDRTARIQKMSETNAGMFHRAGPIVGPVYYGGMAAVAALWPGVLRQRQNWVYDHDVTALFP
jgi:salicylate hydroxylase